MHRVSHHGIGLLCSWLFDGFKRQCRSWDLVVGGSLCSSDRDAHWTRDACSGASMHLFPLSPCPILVFLDIAQPRPGSKSGSSPAFLGPAANKV